MPMTQENATWFADTFSKIVENVGLALLGKEEVIRLALTAMLAEGHLLLEDAPGTGKTGTCRGACRRVYIKLWDWPANAEVTCRVNWGGTQTAATIRTDANGNADGSPQFSGLGYLVTAYESDANEIACDGGTPRH